uniref:EB domain-containing protein n=1 Tax=Plectus sambesii TaxID=2011161 RepID=A0A914XLX7_9BILA
MTVAIRLTVVSLGVLLILQVSIVSGQVCELPIPDTCDTTVPYTRQNQPYGAPCNSLPGECAATLICRLGVCSCPDGNDFINNICAVAPGFGAPCTQGRCKSPVLCDATGYCNQCPAGFNSTGFGCTAACGVNDIRTENGCLPPVTAVGGQCQDSSQCQVGYSQCINSRCMCALGTQQIGNSCQPTIIRCPFGEAFKFQNGSVQSCKTVVCSATINRPAMEVSGCPFDYTCFRTSLQLDSGVCCPNEKPWCPIGEPLLDRSCNDSLIGQPQPPPSIFNTIQPVNGGIYNGADGRCPTKTHYCHRA